MLHQTSANERATARLKPASQIGFGFGVGHLVVGAEGGAGEDDSAKLFSIWQLVECQSTRNTMKRLRLVIVAARPCTLPYAVWLMSY